MHGVYVGLCVDFRDQPWHLALPCISALDVLRAVGWVHVYV